MDSNLKFVNGIILIKKKNWKKWQIPQLSAMVEHTASSLELSDHSNQFGWIKPGETGV